MISLVLEKLKKNKPDEEPKIAVIDKTLITPELCDEIGGTWDNEKEQCIVEEKKIPDGVIFKRLPVKKMTKKGERQSEESYE